MLLTCELKDEQFGKYEVDTNCPCVVTKSTKEVLGSGVVAMATDFHTGISLFDMSIGVRKWCAQSGISIQHTYALICDTDHFAYNTKYMFVFEFDTPRDAMLFKLSWL